VRSHSITIMSCHRCSFRHDFVIATAGEIAWLQFSDISATDRIDCQLQGTPFHHMYSTVLRLTLIKIPCS